MRARRAARLFAAGTLAVGALAVAPGAVGRMTATQTLDVTFTASSSVQVTLPDGTPVGTTTGAPTVIPAGYYGIVMTGPGGCIQQPLFHLHGPGEDLVNDMSGGEVTSEYYEAFLAPNSTYTWRTDNSDQAPVYTFTTNGVVGGSAPSASSAGGPAGTAVKPTSQDIVGSGIAPFRGTLDGAVNAAGRLTLAFEGRSVTHLTPGRYTIAVVDRSGSSGFGLQKGRHPFVSVTGARFVGRRSLMVDLTPGTWAFRPKPGVATFSITVS